MQSNPLSSSQDGLQNQLEVAQSLLAEANIQIRDLQGQLADAQLSLKQKDEEITNLNDELTEREERIRILTNNLEDREKSIVVLQHQVRTLEIRLDEESRATRNLTRELSALERKCRNQERELIDLERTDRNQERKIKNLESRAASEKEKAHGALLGGEAYFRTHNRLLEFILGHEPTWNEKAKFNSISKFLRKTENTYPNQWSNVFEWFGLTNSEDFGKFIVRVEQSLRDLRNASVHTWQTLGGEPISDPNTALSYISKAYIAVETQEIAEKLLNGLDRCTRHLHVEFSSALLFCNFTVDG